MTERGENPWVRRAKEGGQMTDGQVNRAAGSGRGVYKVLGWVLLCLLAGAAGGLSYATWSAGDGLSEPNEPKSILLEDGPDYVTAEDLGIKGRFRVVRFPAGYKVRITGQLWTRGKSETQGRFEWYRIEDYWRVDPNAPGRLRLGVKTIDATVLQQNSDKELKVTFNMPVSTVSDWCDKGAGTGLEGWFGGKSPVEFTPEDVGQDKIVAMVYYGGRVDLSQIPTAEDLKEVGFYAGVWGRLEELTPEDRNRPISETDRSLGSVFHLMDANGTPL